ncbi:hypothetical protein PgNI_05143 [Pyricularia grisea]|uniref:Uncharacterized protein n=1 Tax=Pyricularia grisea TaxID=148305 RepID=A0A6P8B7V5_PYRGI|nr:hypothetical protein PgNI_05143 [Pyricularia grisea]TLD11360.1 hypothetical protein PgNI_05143 [Pyricularia grisea]
MQSPIRGGLLCLVHLPNGYQFASPVNRVKDIELGGIVRARARQVKAPRWHCLGLRSRGRLPPNLAEGQPIMPMRSAFFIRGQPETVLARPRSENLPKVVETYLIEAGSSPKTLGFHLESQVQQVYKQLVCPLRERSYAPGQPGMYCTHKRRGDSRLPYLEVPEQKRADK